MLEQRMAEIAPLLPGILISVWIIAGGLGYVLGRIHGRQGRED